MNKHEAKKRVKDLENSLSFHKTEYEKELKRLDDESKLYKGWFETSRQDNKKLITENNNLFKELKDNGRNLLDFMKKTNRLPMTEEAIKEVLLDYSLINKRK